MRHQTCGSRTLLQQLRLCVLSVSHSRPGVLAVWVKGHKKLVIILSFLLVAALVLAIALPVGLANRNNGTYYLYAYEQFNENEYYKLDGGKWTNAAGESGTYELNGDSITFYQNLFGSNMELASGTLKDGIITLSIAGMEMKYAKKDAVHVHEYKNWKVRMFVWQDADPFPSPRGA